MTDTRRNRSRSCGWAVLAMSGCLSIAQTCFAEPGELSAYLAYCERSTSGCVCSTESAEQTISLAAFEEHIRRTAYNMEDPFHLARVDQGLQACAATSRVPSSDPAGTSPLASARRTSPGATPR